MKSYQKLPTKPNPRSGFTLIELIMVIAIIAALAALIFPAINSVRSNVRVTEVRQEISGLESAIADFKLKFGQTPPSRVTLHETVAGWNGDSQSRAIIRGLWPKFNFGIARRLNDDNSDGVIDSSDDATDSILLEGDQCLVFFLGGFWNQNQGFRGFSPIPTDPFAAALGTTGPSSAVGPFFDFDISRVVNVDGGVAGADYTVAPNASLAFFPVYFDPIPDQQKPYLYASSYEGTGYNVADMQTPAAPTFTGYTVNANGLGWKSKTFQITSPGFDGDYGTGGLYDPDASPAIDAAGKDNITNFASGMLDQ